MRKSLLVLLFVLFSYWGWGQVSTKGDSFWVTFLPNGSVTSQSAYYIAAFPDQNGTVTLIR